MTTLHLDYIGKFKRATVLHDMAETLMKKGKTLYEAECQLESWMNDPVKLRIINAIAAVDASHHTF